MFAPAVDHDLSHELGEIDAILCAHPEWERWVHADLVRGVAHEGGLPVVLFCAGGIATPADAVRRVSSRISLRIFSAVSPTVGSPNH